VQCIVRQRRWLKVHHQLRAGLVLLQGGEPRGWCSSRTQQLRRGDTSSASSCAGFGFKAVAVDSVCAEGMYAQAMRAQRSVDRYVGNLACGAEKWQAAAMCPDPDGNVWLFLVAKWKSACFAGPLLWLAGRLTCTNWLWHNRH
jgi:hypothetical protein